MVWDVLFLSIVITAVSSIFKIGKRVGSRKGYAAGRAHGRRR